MVAVAIGRDEGRITKEEQASGEIFLVKSRSTEDALQLVEPYASPDATLISITRMFPEKTSPSSSFGSVEHYWLTNLVGDRRIPPGALSRLISIVKAQLDSRRRTVVFLEGVEYLILENDFGTVLKVLNQLCDLAISSSSMVFISVDPLALSQKDVAMIERTCGALVLGADYEVF